LEIIMQRDTTTIFALFGILVMATPVASANPNSTAFTDPKQAGIEFELQGEYVGEQDSDTGKTKIGVQVLAMGDRKFRAIAYIGGLPGNGWSRGQERHSGKGELKDGLVRFNLDGDTTDGFTAILKNGQIAILRDKKTVANLKKIVRKSPTLGAQPPKGAIILFDGTNLDAWDNGKFVEENLMGATGAFSKRKFGDHVLHIEFRTPFMPAARGQGRGNSGVYIQSRYECQVLDSFGLEGENNECGAIYTIAKPAINMCFPPLSWQTYDIDFTAARYDDNGNKTKNARVTIKHNGIIIHENFELSGATPGHHPEGPEPDSVFLQNHHNPVAFRNIWVVEKR
jgi:hypothetical protein